LNILLYNSIGGLTLKEDTAFKERDKLEAKMTAVFGEKIKELSTELQEILIDDMVTAFENRLTVFYRANAEGKGDIT
jgi:hypothetical protein